MSTEKTELEQTFADMCVLYELALASGSSLDLRETCTHFLSVLAARKGFSYAGLWLRRDALPAPRREQTSEGPPSLELIYGAPRSRIGARSLPLTHPAWRRAEARSFSTTSDADFAQISGAGGIYTLFPLGEFGLLSVHAKQRSEVLGAVELAQLDAVVRSFAAAVDRCITHERLVLEVAERERAERENLAMQAQLRHSQKLEAVGRLAGGIAHDFNNLLMSILSTVELMQLDAEDPQMLEDLGDIENAGQRAAELTHQLLTFARPSEAKSEAVDLDELVLEVAKLLRRTFDRNVELVTRVSLGGRKIHGTASALHTVLMNLAINARDAMPDGGALLIETHPSPVELGERAGEFVALRITDNGQGMSEEVRERIFDPFFTTKEHGRGTGLGLATVYGIIKSHKGEIRVTSKLSEGTTFEVLLPVAREHALAQDPSPAPSGELPKAALPAPGSVANAPAAPSQPRQGLILLIDDGEGPRPTVAAVLERLGYEVTLAQSSRRTLELADAHSGLHAVVLSLRELDKTKLTTLTQLRHGLPTLPVVRFETPSNAASEQLEQLAQLGMCTRLAKSFDLELLREAIARARVAALQRPWDQLG